MELAFAYVEIPLPCLIIQEKRTSISTVALVSAVLEKESAFGDVGSVQIL